MDITLQPVLAKPLPNYGPHELAFRIRSLNAVLKTDALEVAAQTLEGKQAVQNVPLSDREISIGFVRAALPAKDLPSFTAGVKFAEERHEVKYVCENT